MKKNLILFILPFLCSFHGFFLQAQQIFINEFMASNTRSLADASGAFEDWIEIYNHETSPVNLSGFYLTDDLNNLKKHRSNATGTEMVIPAGGYLIVWASSKTGKGTLHLGFGLSAGGESLAVVAPDGVTILDSLRFGIQKPDLSMGRLQTGGGDWYFFQEPTPGKANQSSKGYKGFLDPPVFSKPAGFYKDAFELGFSTPDAGATIIYTLDGSEPDTGNISGRAYAYKNSYPGRVGDPIGPLLTDTLRTFVFRNGVLIRDRTPDAPVLANKSSTADVQPYIPPSDFFKGTAVRARTVKEGYLPSEIITQTYFVDSDNNLPNLLPVGALTIPANQLFGYKEGIYNAGEAFDVWRSKNPFETNLFRANLNYTKSGDASERIGHFEYFTGNSRPVSQRIGLRLHGSSGRHKLVKTLRLYARSELGEPYFNHSFFAGYPYGSFKRLLLRPDDWERTAIRDLAVQQMVKGLHFEIQEGQPSILFINGEFWGIHNVRERYDRYFFERKYGIPEGELDLLEDNALVEEGDNKDYLALRDYIRSNDLKDTAHFEYVKSKMDLENYTDYFINGMFIANRDWPNNNIRFYRKNAPSPAGTIGPADGRWRWILFDTDGSYTNFQVNDNYLDRIIPNELVFLKNLLPVPAYRDYFINRYADLLNSVFVSAFGTAKIDRIAGLVKPYIPAHRYRLENDKDLNSWNNGITDMKNFANRRPAIVRRHLQEYFNLGDTQRITVNVLQPEMGFITVNTIDIKAGTPGISPQPYPWQGIYFSGLPVRLMAKAKPGYRFVKWQGDIASILDTQVIQLSGPFLAEAVFEPLPAAPADQLIHYWHFNNLPSGTLQAVPADSSLLAGAQITYPGTGAGYLDRVAGEGSALNAVSGTSGGTALRVRNPSHTRELIIKTPTTGFGDISISWAAIRTGSGSQEQAVYYNTDTLHNTWNEISAAVAVTENYQMYQFSLKGIAAVEDNPHFAIKVLFTGSNSAGSSGNNRFDNIRITGRPFDKACAGAPSQTWYRDADNDGYSDGSRTEQCAQPAGYKLLSALTGTRPDCNDDDSLEKPLAAWYKDADRDGYSEGSTLVQCQRPQGYRSISELIALSGDCNDADSLVNPATTWYKDADGDGYGDGDRMVPCTQPEGFFAEKGLKSVSGDCNDADNALNPETPWFKDLDNDGYSDGTLVKQCLRPDGYKPAGELKAGTPDCRDDDSTLNPGTVWYNDADGDGYSNGDTLMRCLQPAGFKLASGLKAVSGDCNDAEPAINPETIWYSDADNDGYSDGITLVQCVRPDGFKSPRF